MIARRHVRGMAAISCALAAMAGCGPSGADLLHAVESYDTRLVEAYRTSDPRAVEGVVGADEARRIAALIGVKRDMGVTLDAQLLELKLEGTERLGGEFVVSTVERWYYQDRRIGSGERVGQDSTDSYRMRYHLRRRGSALLVEEVEFARPPEVGRTEIPGATWDALHGVETRPPARLPTGPDGRPVPDGVVLHAPGDGARAAGGSGEARR